MHFITHGRQRAMALGFALLVATSGCTSGAKKGAAVGGTLGAITGAVIGNQADKTGTGAVVGATVGATAGAIIGDYMSRQREDLEQVPGAEVVQDGEELRVQFANAILFDTDSAVLKTSSKDNLQDLASVLKKYPDTDLVVLGHTDNTGSESHNQRLSEERSYAVKDYLVTYGVKAGRLEARGLGEMRPVASNETAEGRARNRRVEIQIAANEHLRQRAMQEAETR